MYFGIKGLQKTKRNERQDAVVTEIGPPEQTPDGINIYDVKVKYSYQQKDYIGVVRILDPPPNVGDKITVYIDKNHPKHVSTEEVVGDKTLSIIAIIVGAAFYFVSLFPISKAVILWRQSRTQ